MDALAAPHELGLAPEPVALSVLPAGSRGTVVGVGEPQKALSALHRRLLELGFCSGESFEVIAEARPGRDPFVIRVGHTTLALRRCETEHVWVELQSGETARRSPSLATAKPRARLSAPAPLGRTTL